MAGGGRVKSFESSQGENKTYSIHVEKVPGEGTLKTFSSSWGRES